MNRLKPANTSFFLSLAVFLNLIATVPAVSQGCTQITIYRPNVFNYSLMPAVIYINNVKITDLSNNAILSLEVPSAGSYNISAKIGIRGETFRVKTEKTLQVNCGLETFVHINANALDARAFLVPVHVSEATPEIGKIPPANVTRLQVNGSPSVAAASSEPSRIEADPPPVLTRNQEPDSPSQQASSQAPPTPVIHAGKSYALIIGVNQYQDNNMNDLDQPVADARKLYNVLVQKYTFEPANVTFLQDPTKHDITISLEKFYERLTPEDNLLVFYAGHGYWDERFQQGYWLAADASRENRGTWLSNGTIRDYIRAIPSKHILLITDACFGGGIFKSRAAFANSSTAIEQLYRFPSRKAMTSGAMSEVPDQSVFIEYLVKRLEQNTEPYLSSEQLFASFKIAVINNSANAQVPQFGEIRETGDEGGDYIFVRRR